MDSKWKPCPGFPEQLVLSLIPSFSHQDIQKLLIRRQDKSIIFTSRECTDKAFKNVCDSCEQWFSQLLGTKEELASEHEGEDDEKENWFDGYQNTDLENSKGYDDDMLVSDVDVDNINSDIDEDWEIENKGLKKEKVRNSVNMKSQKNGGNKDPELKPDEPTSISCSICGEVLINLGKKKASRMLFVHERDVHEMHQCICHTCGKGFKSKSMLNTHINGTHSTAPLSKCDICGLEFKFLEAHMKNMHGTKDKVKIHKQWICEVCGKIFKFKETHAEHFRKHHTGEKPFSCKECGKSFYRRKQRDRCLKLHKGKDSYKYGCEFCGMKFLENDKLRTHLRTHTQEKPYSCPLCSYKAARRDYMRKHVNSQHKDTSLAQLQEMYPEFLSLASTESKVAT